MSEGRRPKVFMTVGVQVVIEVERTEDEKRASRLALDDGTIGRFMEWCRERGVFPMRGGSVGPGFYSHWFDAEHSTAIIEFFNSEGFPDGA